MSCKVSICIPAYKQVSRLEMVLDSILEQDFADFEVILSDDSPDDQVAALVARFKDKLAIRYFRNQPALGSPENWNFAIKQAKGTYIKIMHHDDYFANPGSLSAFVRMLDDNPMADFAFSAEIIRNVLQNTNRHHAATNAQLEVLAATPEILFQGNFIGPPSVTIYRARVKEIYDPKLVWLVDLDFYIRCLWQNPNFIFTEEPLIVNTVGDNHNITNHCVGNRELEIFEYVYLYRKLLKKAPRLQFDKSMFIFMARLFMRYNIRSMSDFKLVSMGLQLPWTLRAYLAVYLRALRIKSFFFQ